MPAWPVPSTSGIPGGTVASSDQFDAVLAPLANELADSKVNVQRVELNHYHYGEMWMGIEWTAELTFPLPDIQSGHIKSLAAPMRVLAFDYCTGMVIVPGPRNATQRFHGCRVQLPKMVTERSWRKNWRRFYWMVVTVSVQCTSSRQKVNRSELKTCYTRLKSSAGTVSLLERLERSSCRECRTRIWRLCAWTARFCLL